MYRADTWKPDRLLDWYVRSLADRGWSADPTGGDGAAIFRKGARTLAVKVSRTKAGHTVASVLELS
jgi:hypothetical protein